MSIGNGRAVFPASQIPIFGSGIALTHIPREIRMVVLSPDPAKGVSGTISDLVAIGCTQSRPFARQGANNRLFRVSEYRGNVPNAWEAFGVDTQSTEVRVDASVQPVIDVNAACPPRQAAARAAGPTVIHLHCCTSHSRHRDNGPARVPATFVRSFSDAAGRCLHYNSLSGMQAVWIIDLLSSIPLVHTCGLCRPRKVASLQIRCMSGLSVVLHRLCALPYPVTVRTTCTPFAIPHPLS